MDNTEKRIAAIESRTLSASYGPWYVHGDGLMYWEVRTEPPEKDWEPSSFCGDHCDCELEVYDNGYAVVQHAGEGGIQNEHDAEFIAHSVEDIPWLISELRRHKGLLEEARKALSLIEMATEQNSGRSQMMHEITMEAIKQLKG